MSDTPQPSRGLKRKAESKGPYPAKVTDTYFMRFLQDGPKAVPPPRPPPPPTPKRPRLDPGPARSSSTALRATGPQPNGPQAGNRTSIHIRGGAFEDDSLPPKLGAIHSGSIMGEFSQRSKSSAGPSKHKQRNAKPSTANRSTLPGPEAPNYGNDGAQGGPTSAGDNDCDGSGTNDKDGRDLGNNGNTGYGYDYGSTGSGRAGSNRPGGKPFSFRSNKKHKRNTAYDVITYSEYQVKAPHTPYLYISRPHRRARDKLIASIVRGRRRHGYLIGVSTPIHTVDFFRAENLPTGMPRLIKDVSKPWIKAVSELWERADYDWDVVKRYMRIIAERHYMGKTNAKLHHTDIDAAYMRLHGDLGNRS